jgi:hypothetical protein
MLLKHGTRVTAIAKEHYCQAHVVAVCKATKFSTIRLTSRVKHLLSRCTPKFVTGKFIRDRTLLYVPTFKLTANPKFSHQ